MIKSETRGEQNNNFGGALRRSMDNNYKIINGDCLEELDKLPPMSIDCIVTDPPYELGFMGKSWDNTGVSFNKKYLGKVPKSVKARWIPTSLWWH